MPLLKTALVYDFDGTLAKGNIQEHSFIPSIGTDVKEFWAEAQKLSREQDADPILTYMWVMLRQTGHPITRELLAGHGADVPLFNGVQEWFPRINAYASKIGLSLEHYIISSGIREMIQGCPVAHEFEEIFASHFIYMDGKAVWPGASVNYTTKTQYLFRINKGIKNHWDNESINKWMPMQERPVPFSRILFIGDGETDVPSMKMVRLQGGHSIAVFDPDKWETPGTQKLTRRLIAEDRINFFTPADYLEGSQLDVTVKGLLGKIAREEAQYRGAD